MKLGIVKMFIYPLTAILGNWLLDIQEVLQPFIWNLLGNYNKEYNVILLR